MKTKVTNILNISFITISIIILLLTYNYIPNKLPTHYDFFGNPDAWGDKSSIWVIIIVVIVLNIILHIVGMFPQTWNIPIELNDSNRSIVYELLSNMLSVLRLEMTIMFISFLYFEITLLRLPTFSLIFFLSLIFSTIVLYMVKIYKHKI
ncbi:MAG: DUF1648 domain-containing protein [Erysipelotrichaceae bacterium]